MLRIRLGGGITACGLVLVILSFQARLFWDENSLEYLNLKEAGMVYGFLVMIFGIVLIIMKNVSVLQYLWLTWIGLLAIQLTRFSGKEIYVSHVMNSIEVFWIVLILGAILGVYSIWYKCRSIF